MSLNRLKVFFLRPETGLAFNSPQVALSNSSLQMLGQENQTFFCYADLGRDTTVDWEVAKQIEGPLRRWAQDRTFGVPRQCHEQLNEHSN